MQDISKYTLSAPPPKDHPDLAKWVWGLFTDSYSEKERLGLMDRWKSNYRLFRGNHWGENGRDPNKVTINLFFANVQRTVANITAKNPVAEVIDLDGNQDQADQVLTLRMKKWWNETEQQSQLCKSSLNCENYGITIEKAVWDSSKKRFMPVIIDPYSYFPAPGYYDDIQDMPYQIHAFAVPVYQVEGIFNVDDIRADNVQDILGREDRENERPNIILADSGVGVVHDQQKTKQVSGSDNNAEALVVECWIKDFSEDADGNLIYPDGVRVITVCNEDRLLNDMPNPNINWEIDQEATESSFAWGKTPFYKANSYEDTTSIWGFSAAEQTGDLNKKINEIVSRMVAYVNRILFPTLIVEKGCGITKSMINNKPGLVLMPTRPNARIEYLPVPNLPSNFFDILHELINFHDRIYQIEDADRGRAPTGVTAASAIVSLQERNAVLIRHKIRATEYLCRQRGRWNISFLQNFSVVDERLQVEDDTVSFRGIDLAGRKFNYVIESDSTVAKTSAQEQEQAMVLYQNQAIDRKALLEVLNFPNHKQVVERMGETQLDEALRVMVEAGLDEQQAMQLKQYLMQPQTGPESQQGGGTAGPQPGTPRAYQGGA